ncbi:MAG TPA: hypothetical protein VJ720_05520, partial [Chitinophaga sp.]|nr:hypothetical protein [Chitinophaga sp.]
CNYSSKNQTGKLITIKHVSVAKIPMVCERDNSSFLNLTDSLLFQSKLWPEAIKIIQDSIQYYYHIDSIVSNSTLIDEIIFQKEILEKFDKAKNIDSLKLVISRNFDNIAFDSYGLMSSGNIKLNMSTTYNDFWEIKNQLVKVEEDSATKKLFFVTKNGKKISFSDVVPLRNYVSDIRFKEQLIVYYANKRVDSVSVSSPKVEDASHLTRLAESLQEAKSL